MSAIVHQMKKKRIRRPVMLTIDPVVWQEFQEWAEKYGMSASRLVEISMKAQCRLDKAPLTEIMGGVMSDMIESSEELTAGEKRALKVKMEEAL